MLKSQSGATASGPLTLRSASEKISTLQNPKPVDIKKPEVSKEPLNQSTATKVADDQGKGEKTLKPEINKKDDPAKLQKAQTENVDQETQDTEIESESDQTEVEGEDNEEISDAGETEEADVEDGETAEEEELIEVPNSEGGVDKITAEELIKGYMRTSDYTKKTQELAEQRKQVEATHEEVKDLPQMRKAYQDTGKHFQQVAAVVLQVLDNKFIPKAPPADLMETDPVQYVRMKEAREDALQFRTSIIQEAQKLDAQSRNFLSQEIQKGGQALIREYPALKDETEQRNLREYIKKSYGYDDQAIDTNPDHKLFIMAHKAMKYDAIVNKTKTIKSEVTKPKVLKTNKARSDKLPVQERKRKEAISQHRQVGSIRSAAKALAETMRAKRKKR